MFNLMFTTPVLVQTKLRRVTKVVVALLLLSFHFLSFSTIAQAQSVEIGSGILDRDKIIGPKWTRVNFDPLISDDHIIQVVSDSSTDIRFTVFQVVDAPSPNNKIQIGTSSSSATLAEWTGALDSSEQYYLGVRAVSGSGSYTATLEAPDFFEIISQPSGLAVIEGEDATFSVLAAGSGSLTYQWYANNLAIPGATTDTYSVISTSTGDDGNVYRVDVSNGNGTLSSDNALLTVDALPVLTIVSQPADLTVTEGDDATYSVAATGNGTLAYQWYENDSAIAGATTNSYTVSSTSIGDDGNVYRVDVSDDISTLISDNSTLIVLEEIIVPTTVVSFSQGTIDNDKIAGPRWVRLDFDSLAAANHTIEVNWDSDADVRFRVYEEDGTLISSTIRGANPGIWSGELEANAQYYIGLWSSSGIANYDATIEATIPISIASQPFNRVVTEGEDVTFNVEATGSGTLSYQWFANGSPLPGETADWLTVFATSLAENGTSYVVEVSNGFETVASDVATLTVNAPLVLGLFSQEADTSAWMLDGPAPTLDVDAGVNTNAWGEVLLRVGDVLLVGGDFQGIKPARNASATARPFLAALNAVSGQPVTTFQVPVEVDDVVRALTLSPNGEQIYVGGDFGLLVLDATTGALDFAVSVTRSGNAGRVFDIAVTDSQLYIGGDFNRVNNVYRANIARLSLSGQLDTVWRPKVTHGYRNGNAAPVQSLAVSPNEDVVYVGGNFQFIDDTPVLTTIQNGRISMLSVSALDGSVLPERFFPDVGNNSKGLTAHDIVVTDFYVIIAWGGPNYLSFHSLDGSRLLQYAAKGDVQALQVVGDHVFVGHHGEYFGSSLSPIPQEAVVSLEPRVLVPFKLHSFRIDDPSFLPEQAWQISGTFGVWGIAAAEDSIWVAGQMFQAGSNDRPVDGLVRFPAL